MYKIIGGDGKEYGPISTEQLKRWIAEGRANAQTRVLAEGAQDWRALAEFPEFGFGAPAASPLPPGPPPLSAYAPTAGGMVDAGAAADAPAITLIVVAIVSILGAIVGMMVNNLTGSFSFNSDPNFEWARNFATSVNVPLRVGGILLNLLILGGAIQMKRRRAYGFAMTASILAMIPCMTFCCAGVPVGIWAAVVLNKPEVKGSFH